MVVCTDIADSANTIAIMGGVGRLAPPPSVSMGAVGAQQIIIILLHESSVIEMIPLVQKYS